MNVQMELSRVVITELGDHQVILLKEKDGERSFPILIGMNEAMAIDRRLNDRPVPRPMTHDLLANVIGALGGRLDSIIINDLREHTFIATLNISHNGEIIEVDCRPSDAIALGVALETPIYVADSVLSAVFADSSTREDRLQLLRDRMSMLADRIGDFSARLTDESFLAEAPQEVIKQVKVQLEEMNREYEAIDRVLKKLG